MSDEETKQLLRELLDTQRESAERIRLMEDAYHKQRKEYENYLSLANENQQRYKQVTSIATILRASALVIVGLVLAYLVFFGLHTH